MKYSPIYSHKINKFCEYEASYANFATQLKEQESSKTLHNSVEYKLFWIEKVANQILSAFTNEGKELLIHFFITFYIEDIPGVKELLNVKRIFQTFPLRHNCLQKK